MAHAELLSLSGLLALFPPLYTQIIPTGHVNGWEKGRLAHILAWLGLKPHSVVQVQILARYRYNN